MLEKEEWHLDKKVPIGMILAILGQLVFFTWLANDAFNELKVLKVDMNKVEMKIKEYDSRELRTAERLISVEEQLRNTNKLLEKIWAKMEYGSNGSKTPN